MSMRMPTPPAWTRRLASMTGKELLQLSRDVVLILFLAYAFTLDIYLAGSGVSLELRNAQLSVLDMDRSPASRELASRFLPPTFGPAPAPRDAARGLELIDQGDALAMLRIPHGFQQDLDQGRQAEVQLFVDTSNTVLGNLAASYSETIATDFGQRWRSARIPPDLPRVEARPRVWFNPNLKDAWFMSLTELLNIVTLLAMLLPAMAMVREKERGTIEQLMVTPLTPLEIMLPKVLAMSLVILAGNALSLFGILGPVFGVPMLGSTTLFFAVTALYVFSVSGMGLLIATLSRNLGQAGMLTILVFAPMMFLSGSWSPPESVPEVMRWFMYASPLYHYLEASFGILLKGAGADLLKGHILAMTGQGALLFGLGAWRMRRQFA